MEKIEIGSKFRAFLIGIVFLLTIPPILLWLIPFINFPQEYFWGTIVVVLSVFLFAGYFIYKVAKGEIS